MNVRNAPVLVDQDQQAAARAGGPPRYFALLTPAHGPWFVGTCGRGMARSTDSGRSWSAVGPDLGSSDVNALAVVHGCVFAAAGTAGLLCSADGGDTWDAVGPAGADLFCVCADGDGVVAGAGDGIWAAPSPHGPWRRQPGPPSAVYRVLPDVWLAATERDGVWRRDAVSGAWTPTGVGAAPVYALVDAGGGEVLAGTRGDGLHRSLDGGRTWTRVDWPFDPVIHVLVRAADGTIIAGTGRGPVRRGPDGVWAPMGDEQDLGAHRIFSASVAADGEVLVGSYEGVWSAVPGSARWQAVDTGLQAGEAFAVAAVGRGTAYAGGRGVVWSSGDGGRSWEVDPGAVVDVTTLSLSCAQASPGVRVVYAGTDGGLLRRDAAGRWLPAGLDGVRVFRLFDAGHGVLLAGTLGRGAFRREGDGAWQPVDIGPGHPMVYDFTASRTGALYAATGTLVAGTKAGGVHRSRDGGHTWDALDLDPISTYRVVETSAGVLVAGAQRSCVLRSFDGGDSWDASRPEGCDDSKTYCLVVDPDDRLYLGTGARLLCSDDVAETWREIGRGLDGVTVYALDCQDDGSMLAATSSGVFLSADRGLSWQARG